MSDAADEIAEIAKTIAEQKGAAAAMSELLTLPFGVETSEPKDLIVSGVKIERIAPAAESARAAPLSISPACRKPATSVWLGATRS